MLYLVILIIMHTGRLMQLATNRKENKDNFIHNYFTSYLLNCHKLFNTLPLLSYTIRVRYIQHEYSVNYSFTVRLYAQ